MRGNDKRHWIPMSDFQDFNEHFRRSDVASLCPKEPSDDHDCWSNYWSHWLLDAQQRNISLHLLSKRTLIFKSSRIWRFGVLILFKLHISLLTILNTQTSFSKALIYSVVFDRLVSAICLTKHHQNLLSISWKRWPICLGVMLCHPARCRLEWGCQRRIHSTW